MGQPWERLHGEHEKRWEAFQIYRDLGAERSLARVARQLGKSNTLIERWSGEDSWVMRAEAFDVDLDRIHVRSLIASRRETEKRQLKIANAMQGKLVEALTSLDVQRLTPRDLAYWLDITVKVQRAALRQADRVEVTGEDGGPIEIANLTPDEAQARLAEIAGEIRRRLEDEASPAAVAASVPAETPEVPAEVPGGTPDDGPDGEWTP
jgi:hypothetical protein